MLSICFDEDREWWVPGQVFERLFLTALEHGQLAPALDAWRHVADANGGLLFADIDPAIARDLISGLRAAATSELARLGSDTLHNLDATYKASLEKLLAVTATPPEED